MMQTILKNTIAGLFVLAIFLPVNVQAQEKKKNEEIKIKTSAVCDMCKERIEKVLAFEKGVKKAVLDVETKIATVEYNAQKTSPDKIRKAISKAGYDADDVPVDDKAYQKLPKCCQKGGH